MTPRNVILRPAAESDLIDLYHYITEQSGYPERAIGYIRRIRTYCETLAAFPERGTRRDVMYVQVFGSSALSAVS